MHQNVLHLRLSADLGWDDIRIPSPNATLSAQQSTWARHIFGKCTENGARSVPRSALHALHGGDATGCALAERDCSSPADSWVLRRFLTNLLVVVSEDDWLETLTAVLQKCVRVRFKCLMSCCTLFPGC